jgi:hypothetical protein
MLTELSLTQVCLGATGHSIGVKIKTYDQAVESNWMAELRTDDVSVIETPGNATES